jgi:molybdopterin-guanine dinucleotide biosynthesis protein
MPDHDGLKIIAVTGAHSGVGKTTLSSILLKSLRGFGAIKFTKTPLYTSLIDDEAVIKQKGKDTAILLEAGAEKVLWIKSPYDGLHKVLDIAIEKMNGLKGVVIEGNSPLDFLNPSLVIFIIGHNGEVKPSALNAASRADVLVYNSDKIVEAVDLPFAKRAGAGSFRMNLLEKEGEIDEFISHVKNRIA